jgi:GR25 family glycosyltransferase involved in LPS biosynthesis
MIYILLCILFLFFLSQNAPKELLQNEVREYNIPIYYINLDKSLDRNKHMIEQFKKYNIQNYKRIKAITPSDIPEINKQIYSNVCNGNTELELACLYSHLKTIHTAYINNDEYALILEDDAIIHRLINFKNLFKTAPYDWELLQLHVTNSTIFDKNKDLWLPYKDGNWSTVAYVINRKGMNNILSKIFLNYNKERKLEDFILNGYTLSLYKPCVADFTIYKIAKTYSCNDLLFTSPATTSTIHPEHLPYHQIEEDNILKFFLKNGYKNTDIAYT